MRKMLAAVALVALFGCQGLPVVLDNVLERGVARIPEVAVEHRAEIGAAVDKAVEGGPLDDFAGVGLGALVTTLLGLVGSFLSKSRKDSEKRGAMWQAIGEVSAKVK